MHILAINSGGSSIKFELFAIEKGQETSLLRGSIKRLYRPDSYLEEFYNGLTQKRNIPNLDHEKGLHCMIESLLQSGAVHDIQELDAIGIKLINGGKKITETSFIDDTVIQALEDVSGVTSVHNPPALLAINIFRKLTPDIPLVGVFETTFHLSVPLPHRTYGLPWEITEKYGLEKLGFHGNSYRYITERMPKLTSRTQKMVIAHLGSGCSVCAVKEGKSFDISSGFTPQSGVIMSTRPGDFEPQIITYLQEKEGLSYQEINRLLTKDSGLKGISGISGELWEIEKRAHEGNTRARLAVEVFVYQVKKYIGAYTALLNGLDSLIFTGGIGENDFFIREKICEDLDYLGIEIDQEKNRSTVGKEGQIGTGKVEVWVVPTNEELMVARETFALIARKKEVIP
ncbi:MAG: acetate/propionate family kinase [Candidatus Atribacteria bacterium]|nr:acetate/propionate family kinase [Candidatus Atribacteria bacterium]